jgi:cobalt-zinc-cadmium efflux system outer membrane protein
MMPRHIGAILLLLLFGAAGLFAQQSYTWEQLREKFKAANPTLRAGEIGIDESKAQEITAYLRPNPDFTATLDQLDPFSWNPYRPLGEAFPLLSGSYLHERQHKRELRRDSAQKATAVAASQQADLQRNLLFNLRTSFVQTLQQKSVLAVTVESLEYYDKVLGVSRDRFKAGDIARVDLDRLELQRIQFEADVQTARVNLRTAKIQLLQLLNDRTPVDRFDVTGPFDFHENVLPLEEARQTALATRPDLKAALQSVDKAKTDHQLAVANGSIDPTIGIDFGRNPPIPVYFGIDVTIPLRIFDRNQGEKLRTQLDIGRNEKLHDAAYAQVFSDVDSAYAMLDSNLTLLRPYKERYLKQAVQVRETISFAYQRGGASLLDFLSAQNDYRSIELNYLNLVGAYLNAGSQLNLAVGQEVIQ